MIKINALEFLNNDTFGTDLLDENGNVIYASYQKVTPSLLLQLYFKELYVNDNVFLYSDIDGKTSRPESIEFNEIEAKNVAKYSMIIANIIGLSKAELQELEVAAYYHNIGDITLNKTDAETPEFKQKRAQKGYEYLIKEKKSSIKIAEVTMLYSQKYDPNSFDIHKPGKNIPFYNIVAIANYYNSMRENNYTKEEALTKMAKIGRKKFNPFILHKFINKMRHTDNE